MDDEMRKEVLGEVLMDELKAIREYVEDIPAIKRDVNTIKNYVDELKTDVKAIKAIAKEHEQRITNLETA
ncbi:hypothetical protein BVY00_00580 [bacterium G20]|nr:hypothetical protein BVY00_00580 [bacterium G20]